MYTICKEFSFSASHQLKHLPRSHKCSRLHGHNYRVRVYLSSATLDDNQFVADYAELSVIKKWLDDVFDHRHLNDVFKLLEHETWYTTAENLAELIYYQIYTNPSLGHLLDKVEVSETPKTWAMFDGAEDEE